MKTLKLNLTFYVILTPTMVIAFSGCNQKKGVKPNIILCMADDQGWGDVGYNGHPIIQTPYLDDMAASGLRFDHFYAAAPVCSPTRGSVLTGRTPNRFGCFSWGNTLRPQEITIAEALKTAGYVTGHFGKWHLGSVQKGSPVNPGASGFDEWLSAPNFFDNNPVLSREGVAIQTYGESSMVTIDAAIEFIRKHANSSKPVFAVVWFGSPHNPHKAMAEDSALYEHQVPKLRHFYGEISGIDHAMGKIRDELKKLGISDYTILWYCSDNGGLPNIGSTGGRGHKADIYEGGLRVPAVIEWPDQIRQPRKSQFPSNTFDIYPTLLEIAGVTMPDQPVLDGISLLPVIQNKQEKRDKPMGFWQYTRRGRSISSTKVMAELLEAQAIGKSISDSTMLDLDAAIIKPHYRKDVFPGEAAWLDWPFKLIRFENPSGEVKLELYNIENDSMEQNDLSLVDTRRVNMMLEQIEMWQLSVVESLNGRDY